MDPTYKEFVMMEGKHKVLYIHITKTIYGLLESAMLFYKKLVADLTKYGFKVNPYDLCVANTMAHGKQLTVSWHVDDVKASHANMKVVNEILQWVKKTYGTLGEVKVMRGKIHDYLGMMLDYSVKGQVLIGMVDYIKSMEKSFPQDDLKGAKVASPGNDNLFKVNDGSPNLPPDMKEQFHITVVQGLFACKQAHPNIAPAIAYVTTRVHNPN